MSYAELQEQLGAIMANQQRILDLLAGDEEGTVYLTRMSSPPKRFRRRLKVSRATVSRRRRAGEFKWTMVGQQYRYDWCDYLSKASDNIKSNLVIFRSLNSTCHETSFRVTFDRGLLCHVCSIPQCSLQPRRERNGLIGVVDLQALLANHSLSSVPFSLTMVRVRLCTWEIWVTHIANSCDHLPGFGVAQP